MTLSSLWTNLLASIGADPSSFQNVNFSSINLACFLPLRNDTWKIYIPYSLTPLMIRWYHAMLGHVGIQ
jgi:hypothetical protein